MKQTLIFIIGMVIGALISYYILKGNNNLAEKSDAKQLRQEMLQSISNSLSDLNKDPEVQHVEIKGKKGNVTIHTGMTKDSARLIVGKPDEVNLRTSGNSTYETWGYYIRARRDIKITDLKIEFVNGKLKGIDQD